MELGKYDIVFTVSPWYMGEYLDAMGMQRALEKKGYFVGINPQQPVENIRRNAQVRFPTSINVNFHSSFRPAPNASHNFLFYHEVHDKTEQYLAPFQLFAEYAGVFTPARAYAERVGINALKMAADSALFYKVDEVDKKYKCDVVFIANIHRFRDTSQIKEIISEIRSRGYIVHVYGGGWTKVFGEQDWVRGMLPYDLSRVVYSGAKVGLNIVSGNMLTWGLGTNRLYQMCACGLPTVSYSCRDYLSSYAQDEVIFANDTKNYIDSTIYLLENEEYRAQMSENCLKKTLKEHTWDTRINDFLEIIKNPKQDVKRLLAEEPETIRNNIESYPHDMLIAIPSQDIRTKISMGLAGAINMRDPKIDLSIQLQRGRFRIDNIRNDICKQARKDGWNWLLFLDDDVVLDSNALNYFIDDISSHPEIQVFSGWYKTVCPELGSEPRPCVFTRVETGNNAGVNLRLDKFRKDAPTLIRASRVPAGCLLINIKVLDRFAEAGINPFKFITSEDGALYKKFGELSEDFYFCDRLRDFQIPVFVDTRIYVEHVKNVVFERDKEFMGG